jgi:hypothetical protein
MSPAAAKSSYPGISRRIVSPDVMAPSVCRVRARGKLSRAERCVGGGRAGDDEGGGGVARVWISSKSNGVSEGAGKRGFGEGGSEVGAVAGFDG